MIHDVIDVLFKELSSKGNRLMKMQLIMAVLASLVALPLSLLDKHRQETERESNLVFHKQMESLNAVEQSVKDLIAFVEVQKQQLRESEDVIGRLKSEETQLRPVVEADRKVVTSILEAQEQRSKSAAWKERTIGFALGILASLIASILYTASAKVLRNRRNASGQDT